MAKLTGTQIREKGKELTPARLLAFKLWEQNGQITAAELDQALKEAGFEVVRNTSAAWLTRFRKPSAVRNRKEKRRRLAFKLWEENPQITGAELGRALQEKGFQVPQSTCYSWLKSFKKAKGVGTGRAKRRKERKPSPARLFAFKLWQENPLITLAELGEALLEKGFKTHKTTYYRWLLSFKDGKGVGTYQEKPVTAVEPSQIITLEQIIKAAGSVDTLSVLFYQGVMRELARKDDAYHVLKQECLNKDMLISNLKRELSEVTRERNHIMRDYNEKLTKLRVGTVTLDETRHRLVPKA